MKEAAELRDPTEHYHAQPLEVSFPQDTTVIKYLFDTHILRFFMMNQFTCSKQADVFGAFHNVPSLFIALGPTF